jgi:photosystem II stability/assembly factor-like uncharacterized protein
MKSLFVLLTSIFVCITLNAQLFDESKLHAVKFRNIGPSGMSGRVTAIDVNLHNDHHIIVGTASGGVWESLNGGTSWNPIFDKMDCLAIGSVKFNPINPAEIWVGTGEGNPRNSLNTGRGIYKSIDGGKSWNSMGLIETKTIHRIIVDKNNPNTVYVGALGSPWGPNPERGVFKTVDGGKSWKKILYVNDQTGAADMVVDPNNPNKILVAMWEHSRKPWFFTSGGKGSGLYLTYDGGETWKNISEKEGLPKGDLGRIGIAISASKPNIIYALVEAKENGLYKSTDGGEKWTLVSKKNIGNRPFYYAELYVDPKNENRIFNIYTYVSKSEDGGKSFEQIMDYGNNIHPDHHAFWIHPEDNQYMIGGNDGGLTISRDGGNNWTFVNNIPVGQFYHINIDNDFPYNVYGGMQDNGSWVGPSSVFKSGGIRNHDFRELSFGDGFDVVPYRPDSRYGYSMSQQGYVGFYDRETGYSRTVRPLHPDSVELRFNWNTGIAQDPFNDCGVYFGSQFLHYSNDCGESWDIISPDLTTNDPEKQKYDESGGLTFDATGAENHTTILAIAPDPFDENIIYVGTDDGNLQFTNNGGENWQNQYHKLPGAPKNGWINQIVPSTINKGEYFLVINNYRQNDYKPYLYFTTDYGKSWNKLSTKEFNSFTLTIIQDPTEENLLFVGADDGLYVSFNKGNDWQKFEEKFPSVQVSKLKIQEREKDLVIGTFGRSIWILDDISLFRSITNNEKTLEQSFKLFGPVQAYDLAYRSVDGGRFIAQGEFIGENDNNRGAEIRYWLKPNDDKSELVKDTTNTNEKKDDLKAFVTILDIEGDTVRNFTFEPKSGYQKFNWYLESNGTNYPSKNERKKDENPPSGPKVLPGSYLMKINYADQTDSINISVKADPRRNLNINDLEKKRKLLKEYETTVKEASDAYDRVIQAKKSIKLAKNLLENQPDSVKSLFDEKHKMLEEALDSITIFYFGKEVKKGIKRNSNTLMQSLYNGRRYINALTTGTLIGTALIAKNKAVKHTEEAIALVDSFFDSHWETYKSEVNQLKPIVFPE